MRTGIQRIYLIGNRGAGKSTVGALLAQRLAWSFLDTDRDVEQLANRSVADIFSQLGEPEFRNMERQVLRSKINEINLVTACGGGVVLDTEHRRVLANGWCVWLRGSAETLFYRIEADPETQGLRPQLTDLDSLAEIKQVMHDRGPLYREAANLIIETDNRSPDEVVSDILSAC